TVIDLAQSAHNLEDAYGWVARAVNNRLTTVDRLRDAIAGRAKVRWRRLLLEGLGDVAAGCRSVLELAYLRRVERAHGLPPGQRQAVGTDGRILIDVRYLRYRVRVELDGRAAHPFDHRFRDMRRDNHAVVVGDETLRYGTADVTQRCCEV